MSTSAFKKDASDLSFLELAASLDIASLHPGGRKAARHLLERLEIGSGDYVLDVGCGTARDLAELALRTKCRAIGIDQSEKMVEMARKSIRKNGLANRVIIMKGDAHNLPFGDSNFDVVYIQSVLLQLDKNRAVSELTRVLKPGGRFGSLEFAWDEQPDEHLIKRIIDLTGENFRPLSQEQWTDIFEKAGLKEYYTAFTKKAVVPYPFSEIVATEGWLNTLKGAIRFATLPLHIRKRIRHQTQYIRWIKENGKLGYAIHCYRK